MAQVDVERRGPSIWPWIASLFVFALLIWALLELFGRETPEVPEVEPVVTVPRQGRSGIELGVLLGVPVRGGALRSPA